jgi:hypothetical protein
LSKMAKNGKTWRKWQNYCQNIGKGMTNIDVRWKKGYLKMTRIEKRDKTR